MSTIKSSAENLTLNADGANNDIKFQSNGSEVASIDQAGVLAAGGASIDGAVTINETGADVDFRVEVDTNASRITATNALFVEGSTGNVVLGSGTNTDDSVNLLVTRAGYTSMEIYASENSSARDAVLRLHTRNGGAQCRIYMLDGAGAGDVGGQYYYNHDGDNHIWETAGTQRAQLNANGLCFGTDTAAANALDDYEEGSYTVSISGSTSGSFNMAGNDTLAYTKIGRLVTIQGYIGAQSGSVGGNVRMSLPFAPTNLGVDDQTYNFPSVMLQNQGNTIAGQKYLFLQADGSAYLYRVTDAGSANYISNGDVDGNFEIGVSFTYISG